MNLNQTLKELIALIPDKEKDKLLTRLLKKDLNLVNKLLFEYLKEESVDERREKVINAIIRKMVVWNQFAKTPDDMVVQMRELSGIINEHVYISKDKFGEVVLNLLMIKKMVEINFIILSNTSYNSINKFNIYTLARLFRTLAQLKKLHEDLHLEFKQDLRAIATHLTKLPLFMKAAIYHGFDVNWLDVNNIPDEIDLIQKDLRKRGYLR